MALPNERLFTWCTLVYEMPRRAAEGYVSESTRNSVLRRYLNRRPLTLIESSRPVDEVQKYFRGRNAIGLAPS